MYAPREWRNRGEVTGQRWCRRTPRKIRIERPKRGQLQAAGGLANRAGNAIKKDDLEHTLVCQSVIDVAVMTANIWPVRAMRSASTGSFMGTFPSSAAWLFAEAPSGKNSYRSTGLTAGVFGVMGVGGGCPSSDSSCCGAVTGRARGSGWGDARDDPEWLCRPS